MANNIPGIFATINTRPLGQAAPAQGSDAFFVAGWALWGPVRTPTLVTSWNEYVTKFGGLHPNSEMANAVFMFFKNGGRRVWVSRESVGGTAPGISLSDVAEPAVPTLNVTAKYPSLIADLKVTVQQNPGFVNLIVESATLQRREVYPNFKITFTPAELAAIAAGNSPLYNIARVNEESQLVVLEDLESTSVAPENLPFVQLGSTVTLTGGADNIASITNLNDALAVFTELYGAGQVAAPGFPAQNANLVNHAETFKRIAILEMANTVDTNAELLTFRGAFDSSYAAAYYPPRVKMKDFAGNNQLKSYSPIGAIAALFAKAEDQVGIHKAPANYRLEEVVGWDVATYGALDEGQREFLNEKQINAIVLLPEQGIKAYGARVLKSYGRITAIHEQRILNAIYYRLKRSLQEFVFQPTNESLFREIRSTCGQYLRELYRQGALYSPSGNEDDAYRVICDASNNTPDQLAQNKVTVDVWVRLVGMAEQILIQINSVPLATNLDTVGGNN
jgi:uncharacterized protein